MSPKKSKRQLVVSPSPKDLKPKRSSVSGKIIFWGLVTSISMIMVACLLDYQQGKLADHTSRLPMKVQEATKFLVNIASEVPHKLEVLYDGAKGQIIILTGKMHIGDKTVAHLIFGEEVAEEDPTPKDVKADFEMEDKIEEDTTLDDLKKVEEVAVMMRKQEELRIYEETKQKMKEEAFKAMEEQKKVAMAALLEEKAKLKAKIEAETVSRQVLEDAGTLKASQDELLDNLKTEISSSAEAMKSKLEAQAAAASQKVLDQQKEEMARLSEKLSKKMEKSKKEVEDEAKDEKPTEPSVEAHVVHESPSDDAKKATKKRMYEEDEAE